jgi:hypothetical protein
MTDEVKLQWEDPSWLRQVSDWIHVEAYHQYIDIAGPIQQPHIYPWSTVMRVPTNVGTLFFKATAAETIYETALTKTLAGWFPDRLPDLVAVDTKRGWMLMRDGGEMLRATIRPAKDIAPWKPVISLFSELQMGTAEHVDELLALGVPDWRLARLPELYSRLLQELMPRFTQVCEELAAFGIPETINHGDFHDGNVLVKNGRITLFDWGDGCVAHPFISLRTFFVSIEIALDLEDYSFTPEMAALLDLYLEPWQRFASREDLLSAYNFSRCVASIVKTLMWHQTVSNISGPLRKNYEHIVPELFREFIHYQELLQD